MVTITINTTAAEIAAVCTTAAAAKNYYKELTAAGLDKAAARELTAAAAAIVKERNEAAAAAMAAIRSDIQGARAWYRDGQKVMHAVFVAFVRSAAFKAATKGAQFQGNEIDFINRFSPARLDNGKPVRIVREYVNGVLFVRYRSIDTRRAGAFQSVFDNCLKGVKAARIDEFKQIVIPTKAGK